MDDHDWPLNSGTGPVTIHAYAEYMHMQNTCIFTIVGNKSYLSAQVSLYWKVKLINLING